MVEDGVKKQLDDTCEDVNKQQLDDRSEDGVKKEFELDLGDSVECEILDNGTKVVVHEITSHRAAATRPGYR